jgi:hypothetical protein
MLTYFQVWQFTLYTETKTMYCEIQFAVEQ